MNTNERTDKRPVWRGELALLIVILINSFGVVLMLDSGTGNPQFERQSREEFLNYIKIIPERSFISTDLGQRGNPNPIDGMRQCVRELLDDGIPQKAIDQMVRSNPAHLIGLAA